MRFIAKVKNGRIKMPDIEDPPSGVVEIEVKPIDWVDPSIAEKLPDAFKI